MALLLRGAPLETPYFETVKHNSLKRSDDDGCYQHRPVDPTHFDSGESIAFVVFTLSSALCKSNLPNVCACSQKVKDREELIQQKLMGLCLDFNATP